MKFLSKICFRCVLLIFASSNICAIDDDTFEFTVRMPNSTSEGLDDLVCTSKKLPERESYILRFEPHASMERDHHLMVFGCNDTGSQNRAFWQCNAYMYEPGISVCANGQKAEVIFAWAMDAPAKQLPDGVGFRVGGNTGINYIVVQLHYAKKFGVESPSTSGMTMVMTHQKQPQQVGYYILGSMGSIPPHKKEHHLDAACVFNLPYNITPIGYRTHGHNLAVVNSGYKVKGDDWIEIGRMSPQRPQTFYNISTPGVGLTKGDIVAARCTFNSALRSQTTYVGEHNRDEMCNFYIMYSTYEQSNLKEEYCFHSNSFHLEANFDNVPKDISSLQGIPGASAIRQKFNMDPKRETVLFH